MTKCECEPFQKCLCEKSETEIEKDIIEYLESITHCMAYKTSTKGRKIGKQRVKATKKEKPGKSDIVCCYDGLYIAIEVKSKDGTQQKNQEDFEKEVTAAGGEYWLVRSLEEVIIKLEGK